MTEPILLAARGVKNSTALSSYLERDGYAAMAKAVAMDPSELSALTQALMDAGFSEEEIVKIMGGNFLRIVRERLNP